MKKKAVISLCDLTCEFLKPWAENGYSCHAFDTQHKKAYIVENGIHKYGVDITKNLSIIFLIMQKYEVVFVAGFPPCTELAVSGARHFESKRKKDKDFQHKAVRFFALCEHIAMFSESPYFIENPVSVVSTMWRKPNSSFHPFEYGGYLPRNDINPLSELIPPRDSYPKKTCLWTGNGFEMPTKKTVTTPIGYSPQFHKLGGKSLRTKNIRSATPRGFARAIYEMYS